MQQQNLITFDAVVTDILPDGKYRVRFANGHYVIADQDTSVSRSPVVGDSTRVGISSHDANATRLLFREQKRSS